MNLTGITLVAFYLVVFVIALGLLVFGSIGFAGFALWVVLDVVGVIVAGAIITARSG